MSFGRPPSFSDLTAAPPDRGSFPLDHFGECKNQMMAYMGCLKSNRNSSSPCRALGRDYLECRMSKGLMERDEWRNLGMDNLGRDDGVRDTAAVASSKDSNSSSDSVASKNP